jgi:uncharacterized protein
MRDQLRTQLHQAMKDKDTLRAGTLRLMITELTYKEKETGIPPDEGETIKVLFSMLRKREEAMVEYEKAGRHDLAEKEKAEMVIVREFLPAQLDEGEIRKEAQKVIAETGAADMKAMGKVMGILSKNLAGRAQGAVISKIVKEELSK